MLGLRSGFFGSLMESEVKMRKKSEKRRKIELQNRAGDGGNTEYKCANCESRCESVGCHVKSSAID